VRYSCTQRIFALLCLLVRGSMSLTSSLRQREVGETMHQGRFDFYSDTSEQALQKLENPITLRDTRILAIRFNLHHGDASEIEHQGTKEVF
jgi:hypothetical protein